MARKAQKVNSRRGVQQFAQPPGYWPSHLQEAHIPSYEPSMYYQQGYWDQQGAPCFGCPSTQRTFHCDMTHQQGAYQNSVGWHKHGIPKVSSQQQAETDRLKSEEDSLYIQNEAERLYGQLTAGSDQRDAVLATVHSSVIGDKMQSRIWQHVFDEIASPEVQKAIAQALHQHVRELSCSMHGCHLLGLIILKAPSQVASFVIDELIGFGALATRDRFACRVVNRLIQTMSFKGTRVSELVDEILVDLDLFSYNSVGAPHHVAQQILEFGDPNQRAVVANLLLSRSLVALTRDTFASGTFEKALMFCADPDREAIANRIRQEEGNLKELKKHNSGRFVVKALLNFEEYSQKYTALEVETANMSSELTERAEKKIDDKNIVAIADSDAGISANVDYMSSEMESPMATLENMSEKHTVAVVSCTDPLSSLSLLTPVATVKNTFLEVLPDEPAGVDKCLRRTYTEPLGRQVPHLVLTSIKLATCADKNAINVAHLGNNIKTVEAADECIGERHTVAIANSVEGISADADYMSSEIESPEAILENVAEKQTLAIVSCPDPLSSLSRLTPVATVKNTFLEVLPDEPAGLDNCLRRTYSEPLDRQASQLAVSSIEFASCADKNAINVAHLGSNMKTVEAAQESTGEKHTVAIANCVEGISADVDYMSSQIESPEADLENVAEKQTLAIVSCTDSLSSLSRLTPVATVKNTFLEMLPDEPASVDNCLRRTYTEPLGRQAPQLVFSSIEFATCVDKNAINVAHLGSNMKTVGAADESTGEKNALAFASCAEDAPIETAHTSSEIKSIESAQDTLGEQDIAANFCFVDQPTFEVFHMRKDIEPTEASQDNLSEEQKPAITTFTDLPTLLPYSAPTDHRRECQRANDACIDPRPVLSHSPPQWQVTLKNGFVEDYASASSADKCLLRPSYTEPPKQPALLSFGPECWAQLMLPRARSVVLSSQYF